MTKQEAYEQLTPVVMACLQRSVNQVSDAMPSILAAVEDARSARMQLEDARENLQALKGVIGGLDDEVGSLKRSQLTAHRKLEASDEELARANAHLQSVKRACAANVQTINELRERVSVSQGLVSGKQVDLAAAQVDRSNAECALKILKASNEALWDVANAANALPWSLRFAGSVMAINHHDRSGTIHAARAKHLRAALDKLDQEEVYNRSLSALQAGTRLHEAIERHGDVPPSGLNIPMPEVKPAASPAPVLPNAAILSAAAMVDIIDRQAIRIENLEGELRNALERDTSHDCFIDGHVRDDDSSVHVTGWAVTYQCSHCAARGTVSEFIRSEDLRRAKIADEASRGEGNGE